MRRGYWLKKRVIRAILSGQYDIRVHPIRLIWRHKHCYGYCLDEVAHVDPRRGGSPVWTLVHEMLHLLYPNASEKWVTKRADLLFPRMTYREVKVVEKFIARKYREWRAR